MPEAIKDTLPEAPKCWLCQECGTRVPDTDMLEAPHPFQPEDRVYGCPNCREIGTLVAACVVEGCLGNVCTGSPGAHGFRYAWTCKDH